MTVINAQFRRASDINPDILIPTLRMALSSALSLEDAMFKDRRLRSMEYGLAKSTVTALEACLIAVGLDPEMVRVGR